MEQLFTPFQAVIVVTLPLILAGLAVLAPTIIRYYMRDKRS